MQLSKLNTVYDHDGPFATVYLEGRSPGEDAAEQMRLRWRALRERLLNAGATEDVLDVLETALAQEQAGEQQTDGRVLVATPEAGILLDAPWDAALGCGDAAHWGVLPELGAYVREAARGVRVLLVVADQQGAQIRQEVVAEQHEPRELDAEVVEGGAVEGVHKPREGALSHKQIQRRAEETVSRNAKDIAAHIDTVATRFAPEVLVLAGEVQARTAVRQELSKHLADRLVETDRGGRDEHASDEALTDALLRIADEDSSLSATHRTEQLHAQAAHGHAVQGHESVAQSAEMGAVDTLLLDPDQPAKREAFLLKICAQTSASVAVVAAGTEMTDGVGALLRFAPTG